MDSEDSDIYSDDDSFVEEYEQPRRTLVDMAAPQQPPQVVQIDFMRGVVTKCALKFLTSKASVQSVLDDLFLHYMSAVLGGEDLFSHLWNLTYTPVAGHGLKFDADASSKNRFLLSQFPCLQVNDRFSFVYDYGSTSYVNWRIASVEPASDADLIAEYPIVVDFKAGRLPFDASAECLLTAEEKAASHAFRAARDGKREVEWSRRQEQYVPVQSPNWNGAELRALEELCASGIGFTTAWRRYLEPTLLNRSKGATSGSWFKGKKYMDSIRGTAKQPHAPSLERAWSILYDIRTSHLLTVRALKKPPSRKRPFLATEDAHSDGVSKLTMPTAIDENVCPLIKQAKGYAVEGLQGL